MDISLIATTCLATISPFFPYLINLGNTMTDELAAKLGEEVGENAFKVAKTLWNNITSKKTVDALNTEKRAEIVMQHPNQPSYQDQLKTALIKQLENDIDLAQKLHNVIEGAKGPTQSIVVEGVYTRNINQKSSKSTKQNIRITDSILMDINQEQ